MKLRLALTIALALTAISRPHAVGAEGVFLLEVPDLGLKVEESTAAALPSSYVSRLKLHISKSSQEIPPGKILVRINGEAANTIMSTQAGESWIVCDLDLTFRPGFLLHAGRNSIEASAESMYGRAYYAAFLLDVRTEPASLREVQQEVSVSKPGEKPPWIHLTHPEGPVENVRELTVEGYIEGGTPPYKLTVQGEMVHLHPPAGATRGRNIEPLGGPVSSFSVPVAIAEKQDRIEVTVDDAHNNRMRRIIPVVQGTRAPSQRWALVIGVSRYHDSTMNLQFADRDAEGMREFLLDPHGGAVPRANLLYLANEDATYANINDALSNFLTKPGPDDLTIVYFAGHGTNDPKRPDNYYLLGYDAQRGNIGGTAIPMWLVEGSFERTLQSNLVTMVDACHSGGMGKAVPNMTNQRWIKAGFGRHRAIITASDVDEVSREDAQWGGGHGVFTYYALKGLKGAADRNHDGQISVGELFDYVHEQVVNETGGAQTPTEQAGSERKFLMTSSGYRPATSKLDWLWPAILASQAVGARAQ